MTIQTIQLPDGRAYYKASASFKGKDISVLGLDRRDAIQAVFKAMRVVG